ncbi:ribose 5-phosphate isomerase B [Sphingomicrobium marinum]|uniref:ribose 5-phosphate isomerase B n=1 Tax=Sphingomicrobium marinum TaxID=1227950 RepID=UPI00223F0C23|nr:ribose 5-phosphate isomerase B [Sphingomicrobium marinum]
MRIALASDHAGFALKAILIETLKQAGHEPVDLGPDTADSVDYPDYGKKLADHIAAGESPFGIAICGSGLGISMAVNRNPACRCARVSEPLSAALARQHNDANVVAMGERLVGVDMAKAIVDAFLTTEFEGGRHQRRVDKLTNC